MKRKTTQKQTRKNKKGGIATAGLLVGTTGAVVGAAIGTAAAVTLANEKTRKLIAQKLNKIPTYTEQVLDVLSKEEKEAKARK